MAVKTKSVEASKAVDKIESMPEPQAAPVKAIPIMQGKMVTVQWNNRVYIHSKLHTGVEAFTEGDPILSMGRGEYTVIG
jgi:hypothetical protein